LPTNSAARCAARKARKSSKNIFSTFFDFARLLKIFSIKKKKMFLLDSALNASGRAAGLRFGSGAAEFSPTPPLPPRPRFRRRRISYFALRNAPPVYNF